MVEIIFLTIFAGQIILFIYALVLHIRSEKEKEQSKYVDSRSPLVARLETHIRSLEGELEKTKVGYATAQRALEALQKKKAELSEELAKQKQDYDAGNLELEQLKKEGLEFKDKSLNKEHELERIRCQSLGLENELEEKNKLLQLMEKQNQQMSGRINELESSIESLARETDAQANKKPEEQLSLLQGQLEETKTSLSAAQSELQELRRKKLELSEELSRQKQTNDATRIELKQVKNELEKDLEEKNKLHQLMEDQHRELTSEVTELTSQIEKLEAERIEKEKEKEANQKLKISLEELREELLSTKADYATTQQTLQELEKQRSELRKDLHNQKETYDIGLNQLQQMKRESEELKNKLLDKENELERIRCQAAALEKELEEKIQLVQLLNSQNLQLTAQVKDLESRLANLAKEKETQINLPAESIAKPEISAVLDEEDRRIRKQKDQERQRKRERIGEILLRNKFITEEILHKAIEHQKKSGGGVTEYLLAYGYIEDSQLAQCLCTQFAIPYLPLKAYTIAAEITKLVPVGIAEKYWLIPVDKAEDVLSVVMADPLNTKAIREVENITGCKVQVFLSLFSEIIDALENYYGIVINRKGAQGDRIVPFFIDTKSYSGMERRESIRYKSKINMRFCEPDQYIKSTTIDVSRDGFLFELDHALPTGSIITLEINLPAEVNPLPIVTVARVVRTIPLPNNKFQLGVRIMKISEQELNSILKYAASHAEG